MIPHLLPTVSGSSRPPIGTWYFEPEFSQHELGNPDDDNLSKLEPIGGVEHDWEGNLYTIHQTIVGNSSSTPYSGNDFFVVVKTSPSGVRLWSRFIYADLEMRAFCFSVWNSGSYSEIYIGGSFDSQPDGTTHAAGGLNTRVAFAIAINNLGGVSPTVNWQNYYATDQTSTSTTGYTNCVGWHFMSIKRNNLGSLIGAIQTRGRYGVGLGNYGSAYSWWSPSSVVLVKLNVSNGSVDYAKVINPKRTGIAGSGESNAQIGIIGIGDNDEFSMRNLDFDSNNNLYVMFGYSRSFNFTSGKQGVLLSHFKHPDLTQYGLWEVGNGGRDADSSGVLSIDSNDKIHISYTGHNSSHPHAPTSTYVMCERINSGTDIQSLRGNHYSRLNGFLPYWTVAISVLCGSTHIYLISYPSNIGTQQSIWVQKKRIDSDVVDQDFIIENVLTDDASDVDSQIRCKGAKVFGDFIYINIESHSTQYNHPTLGVRRRKNPILLKLPIADFSGSLPVRKATKWENRHRLDHFSNSSGWDGLNGDGVLTIKARDWTTTAPATLAASNTHLDWTTFPLHTVDYAGNSNGAALTNFAIPNLASTQIIPTEGATNTELTTIKTDI